MDQIKLTTRIVSFVCVVISYMGFWPYYAAKNKY